MERAPGNGDYFYAFVDGVKRSFLRCDVDSWMEFVDDKGAPHLDGHRSASAVPPGTFARVDVSLMAALTAKHERMKDRKVTQ